MDKITNQAEPEPTNQQPTPKQKPLPSKKTKIEETYKITIPPLKKPTLIVKENTNQAEIKPTNPTPTGKPLELKPPPTTKPPQSNSKPNKPKTKPITENKLPLKPSTKPNQHLPIENQPTKPETSTPERISKPTPETSQKKTTKPDKNQTKKKNNNAKTKPETNSDYTSTGKKNTTEKKPVQMDIRSLLAKKKLERLEKLKLMATTTNTSADCDISVHPSHQALLKPSSNNETSGAVILGEKKLNSMVRNGVGSSSETSKSDNSGWKPAKKTETGGQS